MPRVAEKDALMGLYPHAAGWPGVVPDEAVVACFQPVLGLTLRS